jgi:rubrerythrin
MKFSTKEVIDIAVAIEESGYYFYSTCRTRFQDEAFRELFGFLAEEELRHKELFVNMLSSPVAVQGVFTDEYFQYLKAIADSRVFRNKADVDSIVKGLDSLGDAFRIALTAEKDSILWYTELQDMYQSIADTHSILGRLINEERKHVITLLDVQEKLGLAGQ